MVSLGEGLSRAALEKAAWQGEVKGSGLPGVRRQGTEVKNGWQEARV